MWTIFQRDTENALAFSVFGIAMISNVFLGFNLNTPEDFCFPLAA